MNQKTEKELWKNVEWKKKKRIIVPNEKCKIFHQTTVLVG